MANESVVEIPETMRAAVLRDPQVGLQVETIKTPHPGFGEVLVKVSGCGLCSATKSPARSLSWARVTSSLV